MATGGIINNGTKFAYSPASPVSWTRLGQILESPDLGIQRDKVDTTVHGTSIFKRSMPGMAEVMAMSITLLSDPSQATSAAQDAMRTYCVAGTTIYFRAEIPVDRSQSAFRAVEFQAYVKDFTLTGGTPEDRQECQLTVEFDDSAWTWYNAGASAIS
jgi:hypothetical protein